MSDHPAPDEAAESASAERVEPDPLRGSLTSRTWTAVVGLAVLLILLIIFISQNTRAVAIRFLGWTWHPPLAVSLLVAVALGLLIAVCAGTLRILQLRRRVRRTKRAARDHAKSPKDAGRPQD